MVEVRTTPLPNLAVSSRGGDASHAAHHDDHRGCQHHSEAQTGGHPGYLGAHGEDDSAATAHHAEGDTQPAPQQDPVQGHSCGVTDRCLKYKFFVNIITGKYFGGSSQIKCRENNFQNAHKVDF